MRLLLFILGSLLIISTLQSVVYAKVPSNRSLSYSLNKVKNQVKGLNNQTSELKTQLSGMTEANLELQQQVASKEADIQLLKQQQLDLQVAQSAELAKLRKEIADELNSRNSEMSMASYIIMALLTVLGLYLIFEYFQLRRKHQMLWVQTESLNEQILALKESSHGEMLERDSLHHKVMEIEESQHKDREDLYQQIKQVDEQLQRVEFEKKNAQAILNDWLAHPVEHAEVELDSLKQLARSSALPFVDTLKAKALLARYQGEWSKAIGYWDTVLMDEDSGEEETQVSRHTALLNLTYAHYKLAENRSKDDADLKKAVNLSEQIMTEASHYFDDAYGYDSENFLPDDIELTTEEMGLYPQVGRLVNKLDELKNYQSIYNLACVYSKDGQIDDARDCLEQIAKVYTAPNIQQLQEDEDLASVRDMDWFKSIVDQARKDHVVA